MKKILVLLANGVEDMEAVTCIDILDRAGFSITTASVESADQGQDPLLIKGAHGVRFTADTQLVNVADDEFDCIVLPGGLPGADTLGKSTLVVEIIKQQICDNKWVAAICAAPVSVLVKNQLYPEAYMTCYPSMQEMIPEYYRKTKRVMVDKMQHLITSQGPGTAQEFALEIVARLDGKEAAFTVGRELVLLPVIVYSDHSIETLKKAQEKNH